MKRSKRGQYKEVPSSMHLPELPMLDQIPSDLPVFSETPIPSAVRHQWIVLSYILEKDERMSQFKNMNTMINNAIDNR